MDSRDAPGSGTSTLTLDPGTAAPGTYPLTITGTDGTLTHTTPVTFTIRPAVGAATPGQSRLRERVLESRPVGDLRRRDQQRCCRAAARGQLGRLAGRPRHHPHRHAVPTGVIPAGVPSATLSFFQHIDTPDGTGVAHDTMRAQIRSTSNSVLRNLASSTNLNAAAGYGQRAFDLTSFAGQTVRVFLLGKEDATLQTSFVADDFALTTT